jgi:hypothetical protein
MEVRKRPCSVNRALDKRFFGGPILVREALRVKAAQGRDYLSGSTNVIGFRPAVTVIVTPGL